MRVGRFANVPRIVSRTHATPMRIQLHASIRASISSSNGDIDLNSSSAFLHLKRCRQKRLRLSKCQNLVELSLSPAQGQGLYRKKFHKTSRTYGSSSMVSRCISTKEFPRPARLKSWSSVIEGEKQSNLHLAYIALGSNVGDRQNFIELACREMDRQGVCVRRTSSLYETKPMYYHDQNLFLNGVCEVETLLDPLGLLDMLKEIEKDLGRQKSIANGPRPIDLDILLYDTQVISDERLSVPHPRIMEREFVLQPLCDLIPNRSLSAAVGESTFKSRLSSLVKSDSSLSPMTALSSKIRLIFSRSPTRPTHVMAVMNLTPDSFSDGGLHGTAPLSLLSTLESYVSAGASLIDIGGQSTRPGAPQISADEEISRVLPVIQLIRSHPIFDTIAVSIDTYRASVAEAAVAAGADIVNDVSAGRLDHKMLPTVARLGCTIILMHMRGTPETMTAHTEYPEGVIKGVATELQERVEAAEQAGIRRWRIMLDPGIGFAKNQAQNLEILRCFAELRDSEHAVGLPWVVGVSRKGFIGRITGVQTPSERTWGTASAVTAAIQGGADVVRVHDVEEMAQVAKMADAIWRVDPTTHSQSDQHD